MIVNNPLFGRGIVNPQSPFSRIAVGIPYRPWTAAVLGPGSPATIDIRQHLVAGEKVYRYQYPDTLSAALDISQLTAATGTVLSSWVRGEYFNRSVRNVYPWVRL
jgi:hypothetical protein